MDERLFEARLEQMFAETPVFADADLFVVRVSERLERGWTLRRFVIGGLGLAGGLIGGAQVLGSGLMGRIAAVTAGSDHLVSLGLADLAARRLLPPGFTISPEAVWMSAGLAALAIGFGVTRAIKEI